jgi:multicomponent Na+:H+ antiporter subunit E
MAMERGGLSTWTHRVLALVLAWVCIVEGRPEDLWVGLFTVPAALGWLAWLSQGRPREATVSIPALVALAPHFLFRSVMGSVDVARAALRLSLDVKPGFLSVPIQLRTQRGRLFLASLVTLTPGTLGVAVTTRAVVLHVLDSRRHASIQAEVVDLARRVDRAFPPCGARR